MVKRSKVLAKKPDLNATLRWRKNGYSGFRITPEGKKVEKAFGADTTEALKGFEEWCGKIATNSLTESDKLFHETVAVPYLQFLEKGNPIDDDDGPRRHARTFLGIYEAHILPNVRGKTLGELSAENGIFWNDLTLAWSQGTHKREYKANSLGKNNPPKKHKAGRPDKMTVRNWQSLVKAMYAWALDRNPDARKRISVLHVPRIKLVSRTKKDENNPRPTWDFETLYGTLPNAARATSWQMYAFTLLMLYTAQRPTWICALRRSHVEMKGQGIAKLGTLKGGPAHAYDRKNTTNVPMVADLYDAMREVHRQLAGVKGDPAIFGEFDDRGVWQAWSEKQVKYRFESMLKANGLEGSPYKVKHSIATLLQSGAGGRRAVAAHEMEMVIKVSAQTLKRNYTHATAEDVRPLTNAIFPPLIRPKPKLVAGEGEG